MRRFIFAAAVLVAACTKTESPTTAPAEIAAAAGPQGAPAQGGPDLSAVEAVALEPREPVAGTTVVARVVDPRDRMLYFTWYVNGEEVVGEHNDRLDGRFAKKGGRIKVQVIPTEGDNEGESSESPEVTVVNSAPKITGIDLVANENNRLVFKANTDDIDGDAITYRLVAGPAGMSVAGDGTIEWTAPADFAGGVTFAVGASDGESEFVQESSIGSR